MQLFARTAREEQAFGDGARRQADGGVIGDNPFTAADMVELNEAWARGFRAAAGPSTWAISTAYDIGDLVTNGPSVYACVVAGTSAGSGGPTGKNERIVDNTVTWQYQGDGSDVDLTRAGLTRAGEQGYVAVLA